jgi:NAD(P)-dependent dehydrogenase (short-subunit alcohol dehydrogenase family)
MSTILIIGASSGIGRQLALQMVSSGHRVIGTYHTHLPTETPAGIEYHPLHITEDETDLSFLPETLDGLVYCPGSIQLKPFHRIKTADFLEDYKLNVIGAIKIIQAALPALKKGTNPSIVLFSTAAVQMGLNFHTMVSSSKGAIEGLTRALAAEYAPAIRVNSIAPSLTDTPMAAALLNTPEKREANAQRHPLKKVGSPRDIAHMAEFLLSERSGWISGQILHVDGGMTRLRV